MTEPGSAATHKAAVCPYVGLRPFEREDRDNFFGRAHDADLLVDKIFSAPVTLLFARSGFGKSSLLKALVIPQLEDDDVLAVYFDRWTGADPYEELRARLIRAAEEAGVPSPASGGAKVWELVRLLAAVTGRTVTLILDQFEELLVHHGSGLETLRKELARIAREESFDTRLVISLREEFLAALEPMRGEIRELFQSTYRLQGLDGKGIRDAIRRPAERVAAFCEPALVEALVEDLRRANLSGGPQEPQTADLPMLQLVCRRLWSEGAGEDPVRLTLDLYRRLGGSEEILRQHVRGLMPADRKQQLLTADLLRFLAPPSGLKQSFSPGDLALQTERDRGLIENELERLSGARILRSRAFGGSKRFELQHDAFIPVLAPWRDQVLARERARRRGVRGLGAVAVCLLLILGVVLLRTSQARQELRRNTVRCFNDLQEMSKPERDANAPACFDSATRFLLWRDESPRRLDRLAELLEERQDLLPLGYGVELSGLELTSLIDAARTDWPMALEYSTSRKLHQPMFAREWQRWARESAGTRGIPVPRRIRLLPDPTFRLDRVRLTAEGVEPLELEIPAHEERFAVEVSGLSGPGQHFLERFSSRWEPVEGLASAGEDWRVVDRWSLPVWKVAGLHPVDGSGFTARFVAKRLTEEPEALFSGSAVELLLENLESQGRPLTVQEARLARGDRLSRDLAELVRLGRFPNKLAPLLDGLAAYPEEEPKQAAQLVDRELAGLAGSYQARLHGPWGAVGEEGSGSGSERQPIHKAHRDVEGWLPEPERELRLYVGRDLQADWVSRDQLRPRFQQALESARDAFYRRTGVELPGTQVFGWIPEEDLGPKEFRLAVMEQGQFDGQLSSTSPSTALQQVEEELTASAASRAVYWLAPEFVDYHLGQALSQELYAWVRERYSLTDLKLLMRAVLGEPNGGTAATDRALAEGRSLRNIAELMESLVFWTQVEDPLDLSAMAGRLIETQRALSGRTDHEEVGAPFPEIDEALSADDLRVAERAFRRSLRRGREDTVAAFLETAGRMSAQRRQEELAALCESPFDAYGSITLGRRHRIQLVEFLGAGLVAPGSELDRRLRGCLYASFDPALQPDRRSHALAALLDAHPDPDAWPQVEAVWLVERIAADHDPLAGPSLLGTASRFASSVAARAEPGVTAALYWGIQETCSKPGMRSWCSEQLERLAERAQGLAAAHAWVLAESPDPADWESALGWAESASEAFAEQPPAGIEALLAEWQFRGARALANWKLAMVDRGDLSAAEAGLRELTDDRYEFLSIEGRIHLAQFLVENRRLDEATEVIDALIAEDLETAQPYYLLFWSEALAGDKAAAKAAAETVLAKSEAWQNQDDREWALFTGALSLVLLGEGDWEQVGRAFLQTDHEYTPYITMMLYSGMAAAGQDRARELLESRWQEARPDSWERRLEIGDYRAWQEMLLGFYLGQVSRQQIFEALEDPGAFEASPAAALGFSRPAMLCEAYFYEALLARSKQDLEGMRSRLEQAVATGWSQYSEHWMASYLLSEMSGS